MYNTHFKVCWLKKVHFSKTLFGGRFVMPISTDLQSFHKEKNRHNIKRQHVNQRLAKVINNSCFRNKAHEI